MHLHSRSFVAKQSTIKMPTYVYKCTNNSHIFDLIQKFTDDPGAECPTCGSESRRQITSPTVIYKGSGFYTTDYGSGSKSKDKQSKTSSSSESNSGDSSSSSSSKTESTKSSSSTSSKNKSSGNTRSSSNHSHDAGGHTH